MDAKQMATQEQKHEYPVETSNKQISSHRCTAFAKMKSPTLQYAGRLGGNQEFVADPADPDNKSLLERNPDAAPFIPIKALISLNGFRDVALWKQALLEGIATMMSCYITVILSTSPSLNIQAPPVPDGPNGIFGTTSFIGPTVGAITNVIATSLFVFSFAVVTGGHLNATITIATFFARLTTLPRMILYVGFQAAGGVLAGLLVRATLDSKDWKAGGCFFDPNLIGTRQMFTAEFTCALTVLFLAFGVGLDPRQSSTFGPALAPILVGIAAGLCGYATAFAVPGYGGAGLNPDRCLAVWMGTGGSLGVTGASTEFGYAGPNGNRLWVYWTGDILAGLVHGLFYLLAPPWTGSTVASRNKREGNNVSSSDNTQV